MESIPNPKLVGFENDPFVKSMLAARSRLPIQHPLQNSLYLGVFMIDLAIDTYIELKNEKKI